MFQKSENLNQFGLGWEMEGARQGKTSLEAAEIHGRMIHNSCFNTILCLL